jgi:hypothetical protein
VQADLDELEQWNKCAVKAEAAAYAKCPEEDKKKGMCWGTTGRGKIYAIRDVCGSKPSPKALTAQMQSIVNDWCTESSTLSNLPMSLMHTFSVYGGTDSQVFLMAERECAKVFAPYAEKHEKRRQERLKEEARFSVQRQYKPASKYWKIVINTDSRRHVKCILYSGTNKPIAVQEAIITAPVDEVTLSLGDYKGKIVPYLTKCLEQD